MDYAGGYWISLDRRFVAKNTDISVDYQYSSRSNCSRSIHDVKRNLVTRLCSHIRVQTELAQMWKKKYYELTKKIENVWESERIHTDTDRSDGTIRKNIEWYEGCTGGTDQGDGSPNKSD